MVRQRLLGAAALTVALMTGALAEDKVVNVFNWSDYIDESVLEEFTKETGIKVVYDVFDSNDILETKLLAGGTGYDVVVPSAEFLARQIQAGVFQKLDKSKLPNLVNLWPEIETQLAVYDPGNEYAVNYMWGTVGIGYNEDKVKAVDPNTPIDSWKIIFDPATLAKYKDCGVYLLDASEEMIPAALNYLGKDPNSKATADIDAAGELLKTIAPYVQKFHSSEYINALANGDICIAVGYSGDVFQARSRASEANNGVKVDYVIPKEGAKLFFDNMAIPADAPHPDAALAFINFMMKPEVIAKSSNYVSYANGNLASQKFIDPAILGDPAIFPPAETMKHLYGISPYDPKSQRVLTRVWTSVKTGM